MPDILLDILGFPLSLCTYLSKLVKEVAIYNTFIVENVLYITSTICSYLWSVLLVINTCLNYVFEITVDILAELNACKDWLLSLCGTAAISFGHGCLHLLKYFTSFMEYVGILAHRLMPQVYYICYLPVTIVSKTITECWSFILCIYKVLKSIIETFTIIGKLCVQFVESELWSSVVSAFKTSIHTVIDTVIHIYNTTTQFLYYYAVSFSPKLSKYTYIGAIVCIVGYYVILRLLKFIKSSHHRTFPNIFIRSNRNNNREFDDINDIINAWENNNTDESADEYTVNGSDVSDTSNSDDTDRLSDNDSEFESGLSHDSDSDESIQVDVLAPPPGSINKPGYNLRSRSSTPSRSNITENEFNYQMERERDKRVCVVCQQSRKDVLILPCRHMCLCLRCADHILALNVAAKRVCPLCRGKIEKVLQVYV